MSSTGWSRAAPLYKIKVPNDPRLGWRPSSPRVILWTAQVLLMVAILYYLNLKQASVFVISMTLGFTLAGIIVVHFMPENRRARSQCNPLSDDQLRRYVIDVQAAVASQQTGGGKQRQLGFDLGVEPVTAWAWCIVGLAIAFTTGISFIHVVIFLALMPAVVIPAFVNSVLASRWVARFYFRMKNRDCVACGYTPGKSSGQLVICPECGVMLPVMEPVPASPSPNLAVPNCRT